MAEVIVWSHRRAAGKLLLEVDAKGDGYAPGTMVSDADFEWPNGSFPGKFLGEVLSHLVQVVQASGGAWVKNSMTIHVNQLTLSAVSTTSPRRRKSEVKPAAEPDRSVRRFDFDE